MRFFFRSRKFKILAAVLVALIAVAGLLYLFGETAAPGSSLLETVASPFRSAANWVVDQVGGFFSVFSDRDQLTADNEQLRKDNESLVSELLDYQKAMQENEFLKEYLGIKDTHPDFLMEPASVVARDGADPYGGFTLNKGTLDGIAVFDPVITSGGLVGYVTEVGLSYAKVTTLYSNKIQVAALDRRTADVGLVGGTLDLAAEEKTRMFNLQRTSGVTYGDYIVTAGGGVFPEGLLIGRVSAVRSDPTTVSLIAEIRPAVELKTVQNVMVITYFAGQGVVGETEN